MQARTYHIQALTALHIGTGQGVGVVDLPIARAKATNLPQIPGSAIKGVLRDEAAAQYNLNHSDIRTLFGPDSSDADSHAGALAFGDAHLLLLPVRSFAGTVAALGDSAVVLAPSSLREAVVAHLRGAAALTTPEGN